MKLTEIDSYYKIDSDYEGFSGAINYGIDSLMDVLTYTIQREIAKAAYNIGYRATQASLDATEDFIAKPPKEHGVWVIKKDISFKAHISTSTFNAVADEISSQGFKFWKVGMDYWQPIPQGTFSGVKEEKDLIFLKQVELAILKEEEKRLKEHYEKEICDSCKKELIDSKIENNLGVFCSNFCSEIEEKCKNIINSSNIIGLSYGIREASENFAENVILNASRGHGFAAEKANHLKDVFSGKDAKIIGNDNKLNGADRLVDGVQIQTKYCKTGSKCISECFNENGSFRYLNNDGTPMQIEVPSDKYDSAIQAMEDKINKGKIPGVNDPSKAKEIVRKGQFSYEQVRNIAKAGTIESFTYDAINGVRLAGTALGISAAVSFAISIWNGKKFDIALENACYDGLKVGGISWISSILSAQIGRTGIESSLRGFSDLVVKQMGPKTASVIANSMRSSNSIYGAAAMNNVSKLLRGNIVTGVITTAILSSVDIARLIDGKISGSQAIKNIANTASGIAGGTGGWMAGAAAGATAGSVIPFVGNFAGGIIGGIVGSFAAGTAASSLSNKLLDNFIEDDAKLMSQIIEKNLQDLAIDFILNETEIKSIVEEIKKLNLEKELREMFASENRIAYSNFLIKPLVINEIMKRKFIELPNNTDIIIKMKELIEKE